MTVEASEVRQSRKSTYRVKILVTEPWGIPIPGNMRKKKNGGRVDARKVQASKDQETKGIV